MKGLDPVVAIISSLVSILIPVIVVVLVRRWALIKDSEDYLVAGRRAHWALVCASVTSLYIWGSSVMGSAEGAVTWGLAGIWIYPMYSVGLWVFGIWARKMREVFPYAISYTEYFHHRFDKKTHILVLIFAIATSFSGAWIQGLAAGHVLTGLTGGAVPYYVGVIIAGVAVFLYAVVAGLWGSLISTWIFTLIAMPICAIVGVATWIALGGPNPIVTQAAELVQKGILAPSFFEIFNGKAMIQYLIPVLAWALFSLPMQQDYWQTAFAVRDPEKAGKAFRHAGNWWFFMPFLSTTLGFAAMVMIKSGKMPEVPGSQAYSALVGQVLPAGFGILFIWLIFAAVVGTVGGATVAIANMVNDIYRTYINPKATDADITRLARIVVGISTVAIVIVSLTPLSILMVLLFMPMYTAPFVWGFMLSQYKGWVKGTPLFIGGIVGFIVGTYMFLGLNLWGWGMIVAFLVGGLITTLGSLALPGKFDLDKLKSLRREV